MVRTTLTAAILASLALAALPGSAAAATPPQHRVDGKLADWRGKPTMIAGQTRLSRGELIYTDYLYDDHGADLDGIPTPPAYRAVQAPADGDYRYPTDEGRYGHNAADLRELRIAVDGKRLDLLVSLQTMLAGDAAAVMLAIDIDGDEKTGAKAWPHRAGIETPGADRFVTLWGTDGDVRDAEGQVVGRPRQAVNLAENAIEARVSRRSLGALSARPRVWLVTGVADPERGGFASLRGAPTGSQPGGGHAAATAVFNVAFRRETFTKTNGAWSELEQSKALAGGDVARFSQTLDLPRMRRRRSDPPPALEPGYYNAVYRSGHDFGEGIDPKSDLTGGTPAPMLRSRHQPYGLYIPKGYRPGAPLTLVGHSLDLNQNQYGTLTPNLLRQLGDERGAVLVTPSARGVDTWYLEAGFVDALEAWEDAERRFRTDPEGVSITGYSMGGYMTYRLGLLMPDRFARASVYVGPPAYEIWAYPAPVIAEDESWIERANTNKLVENALNLPFEIVHGNADELVPISGVVHQADTFRRLGRVHRFYHHAADDHLSFLTADQWGRTRDWLGVFRREPRPAQVTYKRYPIMDLPELGHRFDGAYWVDGMVLRSSNDPAKAGPTEFGLVEATSFALGRERHAAAAEAFAVPGPTTPAAVRGLKPIPGKPLERRNGFEAKLTNLSAVAFDAARMGLEPGKRIEVELRGDGRTILVLRGAFPRRIEATLDGAVVPLRRTTKRLRLVLELPADAERKLVLTPRR